MSDALETTQETASPAELKLLEKNAHFMPERVFKQLVANIQRDGCLTSAPLVYDDGETKLVLSGNHRVKASLAAGLTEIPIIVVRGELTPQRLTAIQLSHNALVGDDDPNVLRELYESLDLLEQRYTGLTDTDLGVLEDPDLAKLSVGLPKYDEVTIAFLPEDLTEFSDNLEKLKAKADRHRVIWARFEHYEAFFAAVFGVKAARKIGHDGVALMVMSQLALERIEQEREEGSGDATS